MFLQLSKDKNNEYAMIDSTLVRAQRSVAGAIKKGERAKKQRSGNVSVAVGAD